MNAEIIIREMELAAYEMAEAETCERRAHKLRLDATKANRFRPARHDTSVGGR
jgi:hypothetical protein